MNAEIHRWWPPSDWSSEWALVFVTVLLVIGTGILAWYTFRLWTETSKTSERQSEQMRASLAIGKEAADAAIKTAQVSQQMFVAANLPVISVIDVTLLREGGVRATLSLNNDGRSTAVIQRASGYIDVLHRTQTVEKLPLERQLHPFVDHGFLLRPGETATLLEVNRDPGGAPISELPENFESQGYNLWVVGQVEYADEVENVHLTRFARRFDPNTKKFHPHHTPVFELQR